jgi:putative hydrolase of the HAD superfamily
MENLTCPERQEGPGEIRGVIFDFGKVIADFDNARIIGPLAALCAVPAAELARRFQAYPALFSDFEAGAISPDQFLGGVSRLCGRELSEAVFLPIFNDIFTPIPSTVELIGKLKGRYRLGLISNTNYWHFEHYIRKSEAYPLFDAVIMSFQVKTLKPDPRIFEAALAKLGLPAGACVFIDDIPAFAQAASGCGIHGIHYRGHRDLLLQLRALNLTFQ